MLSILRIDDLLRFKASKQYIMTETQNDFTNETIKYSFALLILL